MDAKFDRRRALAALGTVSLGGLLAACGGDGDDSGGSVTTTQGETATVEPKTTPSGASDEMFDGAATCTVTPDLTEGPFYFDVDRIRSDITEDREGTPLRVALRVRDAGSCEPIENAVVDIWHCDALGSYSGFDDQPDRTTYLRGAQVTNGQGVVQFRTIYPGWYPGRTVHIHAKVHLDNQTVLTTQLFTTREYDDRVFARAPYAEDPGRDTFNEDDGIFDESLVMTLSDDGDGDGDGVRGVLTFDVQRT